MGKVEIDCKIMLIKILLKHNITVLNKLNNYLTLHTILKAFFQTTDKAGYFKVLLP
jgi:hypothetical protein